MKPIMTAMLVFLLVMLAAPFAQADDAVPTMVNGHVYGDDGMTPMPDVSVTVTCHDDGGDRVLPDTTNTEGFYVVEFAPGMCSTGSGVDIEAAGVSTNGTVENNIVIKNIMYANLIIPEFSVLAAGMTFIGASLVYLFIRRSK